MGSNVLSGRIVETEAYYGERDPASRAYRGRKNYNEVMFGEPGRAFIYMVHSYWLLNFVAHPAGEVGGVLIRAVEPMEGIWMMKKNREVDEVRELTSGPGKLTRAMAITKDFNGKDITSSTSCLGVVEGPKGNFEIDSSNRIGVKVDLLQKLRFFIKGNKFVSR